ncbi:hypothetical protein [Acinetobacter baumannii]|uniref:hypothetical protein n=6 Tax=Acinetobacter baumannii TaxID=470 RepID=UPI003B43B1F2
MADQIVTRQDLVDAHYDAETLGECINGEENTEVTSRLGRTYWTLATINYLISQGQLKISDLQAAIDIAAAAGAGANGWTDLLIATLGGQTQRALNMRFCSPMFFGAAGDGVADDSAAIQQADNFSIANNATVLIDRDYVAKNLELGGRYLSTGGKIISVINGKTENVVVAKSGLKMDGLRFKTKITGQDGGGNFGYVIRIGNYRQEQDGSSLIHDFNLNNLVFDEDPSGYRGACIEILGNVYDGSVTNITHNGNFYVFIAHWAGDVDLSNPHGSMITYSWHPHDIIIDNLKHNCNSDYSSYANLDYSYVFSAPYNIDARRLNSDKANCTLWITPGDVYNEVTVTEQKDKVFTNIKIDGVFADNPKPNGRPPIFITGEPITRRTTAEKLYAVDDARPMQVKVLNAIVDGRKQARTSGAGAQVYSAKNLELDVNVKGYENSSSSWLLVQHAANSKITASGASTIGARVMVDETSEVKINSVCATTSTQVINLTPIAYTGFTTTLAASKGATTLQCNKRPDVSLFLQVMRKGAFITYNNKVVATIEKSIGIAPDASATTFDVQITALLQDLPLGASLNIYLPNGGTVLGKISGASTGVTATNSYKLNLDGLSIEKFKNFGVDLLGVFHKDLKIRRSKFSCGGENPTESVTSNIRIFTTNAATTNEFDNCEISGNEFDIQCTSKMSHHIYMPQFRRHRGLKIFNNEGNPLPVSTNPAIAIANSTYNAPNSIQQIYGNNFRGHLVASNTVLQGIYHGNVWSGSYAGGVDPSQLLETYFDRGSFVQNANITTQYPGSGWICIQGGYGSAAVFMRQDYFGTTRSATTATLGQKASTVNTSFKYLGVDVYATDNGKFYKAKGSASDAQWVAFDGSVITPV